MADADTEHEPAVGDLVDERDALRKVLHVARVDRCDARAEADLARRQRNRFTQSESIAEARTIDAGKATTLDLLREFERRFAPAGYGSEADRGQSCGHDE